MGNDGPRKEKVREYKQRTQVGGVFAIRNTCNGKALVDATTDMQGSRNRFEFAQGGNPGVFLKLRADWEAQDGEGFVFEALEELEKGEAQTEAAFKDDVQALKELWLERLDGSDLY